MIWVPAIRTRSAAQTAFPAKEEMFVFEALFGKGIADHSTAFAGGFGVIFAELFCAIWPILSSAVKLVLSCKTAPENGVPVQKHCILKICWLGELAIPEISDANFIPVLAKFDLGKVSKPVEGRGMELSGLSERRKIEISGLCERRISEPSVRVNAAESNKAPRANTRCSKRTVLEKRVFRKSMPCVGSGRSGIGFKPGSRVKLLTNPRALSPSLATRPILTRRFSNSQRLLTFFVVQALPDHAFHALWFFSCKSSISSSSCSP